MSMKKSITAVSLLLAVLMMITMLTACADNSIPAQTAPAAPAAEATPAVAAPAESAQPVDPLVGAWRFPPSPYGDDFSVYVVLNADGSFYNATNLYQNGASSGPYTQTITTNETFVWKKLSDYSLELHYSYLDDNGEFVTPLTYSAADDALYWDGALYAVRDNTFVRDN